MYILKVLIIFKFEISFESIKFNFIEIEQFINNIIFYILIQFKLYFSEK